MLGQLSNPAFLSFVMQAGQPGLEQWRILWMQGVACKLKNDAKILRVGCMENGL